MIWTVKRGKFIVGEKLSRPDATMTEVTRQTPPTSPMPARFAHGMDRARVALHASAKKESRKKVISRTLSRESSSESLKPEARSPASSNVESAGAARRSRA